MPAARDYRQKLRYRSDHAYKLPTAAASANRIQKSEYNEGVRTTHVARVERSKIRGPLRTRVARKNACAHYYDAGVDRLRPTGFRQEPERDRHLLTRLSYL